MTKTDTTRKRALLVAVDIAKSHNEVLIESARPAGHRHFRFANTMADYQHLAEYPRRHGESVVIGFEATGNYHRPLAYFLHQQRFELRLIPTMALARTREAMHKLLGQERSEGRTGDPAPAQDRLTQTWRSVAQRHA